MVNSPAAHGKRWFNSTCQSHDLLEAILAGQIKQGGHTAAVSGFRVSALGAQANSPLMAVVLLSVMKPIVPLQRLQAANNTTVT